MCKISKRHKKVLDALSVLNKQKDSMPAHLKQEIIENKEKVLTFLINKYNINISSKATAKLGDYLSIVVDEVVIGRYGFHINLRRVCDFKGEEVVLDRVNPKPPLNFFYAVKIVEDFKKRHNIF